MIIMYQIAIDFLIIYKSEKINKPDRILPAKNNQHGNN